MKDIGKVRADRCCDPGQPCADANTAARLRFAHEIFCCERGDNALHGLARQPNFPGDLRQAQSFGLSFEGSQNAGCASDDLHADACRLVLVTYRLDVHPRSPFAAT